MLTQSPSLQRLSQWIQGIESVSLATVDADGQFLCQPVNFTAFHNGDLWFFIHMEKGNGPSLSPGQDVNLQFSQPCENRYVSVFATADGIYDNESLRITWGTYFHNEDLVLIRARVTHAEFWDAPATEVMEELTFELENARGPVICPATAHLQ